MSFLFLRGLQLQGLLFGAGGLLLGLLRSLLYGMLYDKITNKIFRRNKGSLKEKGDINANITYEEALQILDLPDDWDKELLMQRYHKIISKNHPDTGGSEYLTKKINSAKDFLLKTLDE
ncbi:MAG: hypothetical protein AAF195_01230 [Pseudomonadota bacterium]